METEELGINVSDSLAVFPPLDQSDKNEQNLLGHIFDERETRGEIEKSLKSPIDPENLEYLARWQTYFKYIHGVQDLKASPLNHQIFVDTNLAGEHIKTQTHGPFFIFELFDEKTRCLMDLCCTKISCDNGFFALSHLYSINSHREPIEFTIPFDLNTLELSKIIPNYIKTLFQNREIRNLSKRRYLTIRKAGQTEIDQHLQPITIDDQIWNPFSITETKEQYLNGGKPIVFLEKSEIIYRAFKPQIKRFEFDNGTFKITFQYELAHKIGIEETHFGTLNYDCNVSVLPMSFAPVSIKKSTKA
jgi:hypothetical protein